MTKNEAPILILGAGLTGSLIALALAKRRPEIDFLLVEQSTRLGGRLIAPFFVDSVPLAHRWLIDPLIVNDWARYHTAIPGYGDTLVARIARIVPEQVHAEILETIPVNRVRLASKVVRIEPGGVMLQNGGMVAASVVLDCRPASATIPKTTRWCHTANRVFLFPAPHGLAQPILVDGTLSDSAWAFLQYFPLTRESLLIRYVGYSCDRVAQAPTDTSGSADGGRLLEEVMQVEELNGQAEAAASSPMFHIGARCGRLCAWHPFALSPVAGAVRTAIEVSNLREMSAPSLASTIQRLAGGQSYHHQAVSDLLNSLCDNDPGVRRDALRVLLNLDRASTRRFEAGEPSHDDFRQLTNGLSKGRCADS